MYQAFPYQKFGVAHAKVIKIANSPTAPEDLPTELQAKEGRYRILASLDRQDMPAYGKSLPLVPGMQLEADLILDKRSLLDWLLDPLLAQRTRNQ
jgi:membrane fusion protein